MQLFVLIGLYFLKCTKFDQLILRKIIKIVATRCKILTLKCTKIDFGWGSAPDPAGGAYSALPDPLAGFKGPTSKEGRVGSVQEVRGGEGSGRSTCLPPHFDNPGYGPGHAVKADRKWKFKLKISNA